MSNSKIRLVVILAAISIIGIFITQIFWLRKAFDEKEIQFNHTVNTALKNVAESLLRFNHSAIPEENPVSQLSSNYFVVRINDAIDVNMLEYMIQNEFNTYNLKADFEYGIYDCASEKMVYGNYMSQSDNTITKRSSLPVWNEDNYYFGVLFPNKKRTVIGQMEIWLFSTLVLLIVMVFFAYTLYLILRQRRLSEIQKDFVNNMTHEFKTPISTINISAEVLKNPAIIKSPRRLLNYATIIHEESRRLQKQVDRVLETTTASNTNLQLNAEKLDLHEIITKCKNMLGSNTEDADIKSNFQLDAKQTVITGDKLHLTNMFRNLLDNAIKYAGNEKPEITIVTKNQTNSIIVSIQDNGIGISNKNLKKVFDKFYRVSTGNQHDVKGFGLGLNYVTLVVQAHHGKIDVESNLEIGSTFIITLPLSNDQ